MIEIVYEKEKQKPEGNEEFFRIPNNIRQIGEISGTQKIYIEDYAYTYLCRSSSENSHRGIAAILLGQANWKDGAAYLFIKSAVALPNREVTEEHLTFTQEIWNHVYEKNKEYFPDQEVVGWFLSIPGCAMELHEVICQTHLNHFGGNDKVLFVMEPLEKEEAFYRYEEGRMSRQSGFYVYYEKNEPMRNFLIAQNEKAEHKTEEVDDSAVSSFRKKVEKKGKEEEEKQKFPLFRTASICAAAAVLAVGVLYLNDYQKLRSTEEVMAGLEEKQEAKELQKVTPVNGMADSSKKEENPESEAEKENFRADQGTASSADSQTAGKEQSAPSGQGGTDEQTSGEIEKDEAVLGEERAASKQDSSSAESKQETAEDKAGSAADTDTAQSAGQVHQSYTIQPGDTITRISIRNYGNTKKIKEICSLNNLAETDLIYPGQKILLP